MKDVCSLVALILIVPFDIVVTKKSHVGPCIVVPDSDPCPDPDYIQAYLYTRKNKEKGQYVEFSEESDNLTSSNFNPENPNKIIIHGFNTDMNLDILQNIKEEFLKQMNSNIWMINYPRLVDNGWCYLFAVKNIQHVGKCLAQFIEALRRHNSNDIHVVGFSLGAQVSNFIAQHIGENKLKRITGLDPAGPGFTLMKKKYRLDPSDANFVDVVHTNGGMQGDIESCGHIDFYMNGGVIQPGCSEINGFFNCNHRRAAQYFAESINSKVGFLGWQCRGYTDYIEGKCKPKMKLVPMGEQCPTWGSGFYVAYTASEAPFALGNWTSEYYQRSLSKMSFTKYPKNKNATRLKNDPLERIFINSDYLKNDILDYIKHHPTSNLTVIFKN